MIQRVELFVDDKFQIRTRTSIENGSVEYELSVPMYDPENNTLVMGYKPIKDASNIGDAFNKSEKLMSDHRAALSEFLQKLAEKARQPQLVVANEVPKQNNLK